MNILALESSTQACSVSLLTPQGQSTQFEVAPQQHANLMLPMVQTLLTEANLAGEQLDALALSEGPGAFTGIRIASGVVQGLAMGWDKPVICVSTLAAVAWQAMQQTGQTHCIACLDARMQEIYVQSCQLVDGRLVSEPAQMLSPEALALWLRNQPTCLGAGDLAQAYPELVAQFTTWLPLLPSAEAIAQIAQYQPENAHCLTQQLPLPVYLRNNVALTTQERMKIANEKAQSQIKGA